MKILFIEDDLIIAQGLIYALKAEKFDVDHFSTISDGLMPLIIKPMI